MSSLITHQEVPLWDPYTSSGYPFLFWMVIGVFSFPVYICAFVKALFPALHPPLLYWLYVSIFMLIVTMGAYEFFDEILEKQSSKIICAFLVFFSAYTFSAINSATMLNTYLWQTWTACFLVRYLKRGSRLNLLLMGVFSGLCLGSSGHPPDNVAFLLILFLAIIIFSENRSYAIFTMRKSRVFVDFLIFAVIVACQLMPLFAVYMDYNDIMVPQNHRSIYLSGESPGEVAYGAFSHYMLPKFLISFFSPYFAIDRDDLIRTTLTFSRYVGIGTLFLAVAGVIVKRNSLRFPLAVASLIWILLAIPHWSPLFEIAYRFLPSFDMTRTVLHLSGFICVSLIALAGMGLDFFQSEDVRRKPVLKGLCMACAVVLLALSFPILEGMTVEDNKYFWAISEYANYVFWAFFCVSTFLIFSYAAFSSEQISQFGVAALGLVLVFDVMSFASFEVRKFRKDMDIKSFWCDSCRTEFRFMANRSKGFNTILGAGAMKEFNTGLLYSPVMFKGSLDFMEQVKSEKAKLSLTAVSDSRFLFTDTVTFVKEVESPPNIFEPNSQYKHTASLLDGLQKENLLRKIIFLHGKEGKTPSLNDAKVLAENAKAISPRNQMLRFSANKLSFAMLDLPFDGYLFFSESYDKNWKAYVDSVEVPVHRANIKFQAIPLKAGNHIVTFEFSPTFFKYSLRMSILLSVISIVVWGVCHFHRKKFGRYPNTSEALRFLFGK